MMNDAERAEQQARVERYLQKWVEPLGLSNWRFRYFYYGGPYKDGNGAVKENRLASCEPNWPYMIADLRFDLSEVGSKDEQVEETVIHELLHCILSECEVEEVDHEERVATMLARAFLRAIASLGER